MSETTMPVTEVETKTNEPELASYELAYHILPTVAEGEVTGVSDELKKLITTTGGEIFAEEGAERFELAYEIDKYLEGKYRKFTSAYFGWLRFHLNPSILNSLTEGLTQNKQLLRYLLVRLTKVEEMNPFRFHEALVDTKVRIIDTGEVLGGETAEESTIVEEVELPPTEVSVEEKE
ncbi:hypothetical protein COZ82_02110 [Candidatus Kaiserbacteria bacterium CG_4_8_14_3_um_filter_38_9]|uniref:Small ribosomal subunit protein bS6 n=1 Tax=Candidatus Kaiserbacteria bacterium CG_4_8_14_3_um_filter_38_9 TaxID=1974599 RepID=A0A2M7INM8_9BACT|nr:MAG: hypothetical protein COZ82_02110 [Candidatus Kaiserbacteria bacterium CG_4_8_14_3_um_filter_38_9]